MAQSLKKNVAWMFTGNSIYAFTQWIQFSIITKLCTPLELGTYTLALALTAPVFMFLSLQLRAILVTDSKQENTFSDFFALRSLSMIAALIIVVIVSLFTTIDKRILFLIATLKTIEGFAEIFNAQQQRYERMRYLARSLILKGVTATIGIFCGVFFFNSLTLGLSFAVIFNLVVLYVNDYLNCRHLMGDQRFIFFQNLDLKQLFIKSLPLGVVMLLISLNANISKYITEYFLGTEIQGIYSTIAYCLIIGNFVSQAIGQSFSPRMSNYFANNEPAKFKNLSKKFILMNFTMGVLLLIGTLFVGEFFLRIMFNETISGYSSLFSLIMLAGVFMYTASALGYTLTAMRVFKVQPIINFFVLLTNTVACFILIRTSGLNGVAYATAIAAIVQIILTFYFIKKNYDKSCGSSR